VLLPSPTAWLRDSSMWSAARAGAGKARGTRHAPGQAGAGPYRQQTGWLTGSTRWMSVPLARNTSTAGGALVTVKVLLPLVWVPTHGDIDGAGWQGWDNRSRWKLRTTRWPARSQCQIEPTSLPRILYRRERPTFQLRPMSA
jgi:hypothetical protein